MLRLRLHLFLFCSRDWSFNVMESSLGIPGWILFQFDGIREDIPHCSYAVMLREKSNPTKATCEPLSWLIAVKGTCLLLSLGSNYIRCIKWCRVLWMHSQTWAFDWHYELWPQMTFNPPSSKSLKFDMKYFEKGNSCDYGVNGSRIGNPHGESIDTMTFDLVWP